MPFIQQLVHTLLHLSPETVSQFFQYVGIWLYVVLFLIIFAETGLVITPFLPGDSLLFAVGAVAAMPHSQLSLTGMLLILALAAVLGDALNYAIGYRLGPKVFASESSWLLNRKHLLQAQRFYENYGGKTIIIARFVPIVRTFAPFVAGIGKMRYVRFAAFNIIGGTAWVAALLLAGFWASHIAFLFGGGPERMEKNFKYLILGIIVLSLMPMVIEFLRARMKARRGFSVAQLQETAIGSQAKPDPQDLSPRA